MVDTFTGAIDRVGKQITSEYRESAEAIVNSLNYMQSKADLSAEDVGKKHDQALEMLDNIQRRQKPRVDRFMDGFDKKPY